MNYNIIIDNGTIREFGKGIDVEGNKFIEILDKLLIEVEHINEGFDTKTGKLLKEKLLEVIKEDKKLINEKYISYSKTINNIAKTYEEFNEEIKRSVK